MYQALLKEHIDDKKAYGGSPQPPATREELEDLRQRAKDELGVELPKGYLAFLEQMNGLDSNGLVVYASQTTALVGHPDRSLEGLVEANLGWWDLEKHKRWLFFGESGLALYTLEIATGQYQRIDRSSNDVLETFGAFEDLLARGLEENRP